MNYQIASRGGEGVLPLAASVILAGYKNHTRDLQVHGTKGHGNGGGENLLDASSADKPVNCADSQSKE